MRLAGMVAVAALAAAGGQDAPGDADVLARAYDPKYRYPADFPKDPRLGEFHVPMMRTDAEAGGAKEAREVAQAAYPAPRYTIGACLESPHAFDFEMKDASSAVKLYYVRVEKQGFVKWLAREWKAGWPPRTVGWIATLPVTRASAREVAQFDWLTSNYGLAGAKLLRESATEDEGYFRVTQFEAGISYGDWGLHDVISLYQVTYVIDKLDGEITATKQLVRQIQGRKNEAKIK